MSAHRKASPPVTRPTRQLPVATIMFTLILILALAIRLLPVLYDLAGGRVLFSGLDSYYHMRRIMYTVYHFPSTNVFDSYVNYPAGFFIYWPPLFDQLAAGLSLMVGLGRPDVSTIELVSSLVPALVGVCSIIPLYYIVKDIMGRYAAMIGAFAMAIMPGSVFQSLFGGVDHHGLEVLLSLTMFLFFMRAVSSARTEKLDLLNLAAHKTPLIYATLAGVTMASMVFAWDGAPIFIGIIVAYAFLQYAYDAYYKDDSLYLTAVGSVSALIALVLVAPVAATGFWGSGFHVTAVAISWFHIFFLLAVLAFFLATGTISTALEKRKAPWYALPAVDIGVACVASLAILLLAPGFIAGIGEGLTFLVGGSKVLSTVQEIEPLFSSGGGLSLAAPWAFFSTAMVLSVLGLVAFLLAIWGRKLRHVELFLLAWTVIVLVLGLLQKRFVYLLAVNVSIFTAYAMYAGLDLAGLGQWLGTQNDNTKKRKSRSASMTPALAMMAAAALLLMAPLLFNSVGLALTPSSYVEDWNDACTWVKGHTPATSFLYTADEGTHPEYGIMSWWDYGNYILYKAERPAIANNFQTGIDSASHFFIAQDEASANKIMDACNARYVMLDLRMGSPYAGVQGGIFRSMPYLAGDDPASYYKRSNASSRLTVSQKYNNTMYARLFDLDGCGNLVSNGLEHYRLICATDGQDPVKVFEYVEGARIKGNAAPGAKVELSLALPHRTYHSSTTADSAGEYAFIVPYPTYGTAYTIVAGGRQYAAAVPEDAVTSGAAIVVG